MMRLSLRAFVAPVGYFDFGLWDPELALNACVLRFWYRLVLQFSGIGLYQFGWLREAPRLVMQVSREL